MNNVGIWERGSGVFDRVHGAMAGKEPPAALLRGSHPADFRGEKLDLLCIASTALGWAGGGAIDCQMLLLPGGLGPLARGLRCTCAVSYGTSPKDTLTFSSLEGNQICVALQRELVTLPGGVVEQQEWVLPFPAGSDPMDYLAAAGILLILGLPLGGEPL
ncbi:conserved hypothetical protein [uncultured Eubacteriales bacterium]|uniref:Uncharacterized protein n=1 Tax=uncultured Eubacteriales bacterium TaxID=172733 RepID=A0A212KHH2_9FIRM|nr:conserved hypothetical protein [uncultured Eubacteriales bacterium]